jgi:hypothetical protein
MKNRAYSVVHPFLAPGRGRKVRMAAGTRGAWYPTGVDYLGLCLLYLRFGVYYVVSSAAFGSSGKPVPWLSDALHFDVSWIVLLGRLIFCSVRKSVSVVKLLWFFIRYRLFLGTGLELPFKLVHISLINFFLRVDFSMYVILIFCLISILNVIWSSSTATNRWSFVALFFKNFSYFR